jgi:hypothetical protein
VVFVTIVEGVVDAEREDYLRTSWEATAAGTIPAGFIESSLLRAEDGTWRIVTVWESKDAVLAMRASGEPPAGPRMFAEAGAEPSLSMWDVEGRIRAP